MAAVKVQTAGQETGQELSVDHSCDEIKGNVKTSQSGPGSDFCSWLERFLFLQILNYNDVDVLFPTHYSGQQIEEMSSSFD